MHILTTIGLILFVVFFFGFCIFIHEFGHMLAGLWRGLHVERFSIGFGKKIWGFTRNNVEYVVSALPFGGYVALPQLEPSDQPETSSGEPLPKARPINRILTAVAGPFFNVLFAIFLSLFIWYFGIYQRHIDKLQVVEVPKDSAEYQAGLRPGDRIVKVNGKDFDEGYREVARQIVFSSEAVTLQVKREGRKQPVKITYKPEPNPVAEGLTYPFFKVRSPPAIRGVKPGQPAAQAGLQKNDVILRVDGTLVKNIPHFISLVEKSGGKPLAISVRRNGEKILIEDVRPEKAVTDGKEVYRIGALLKGVEKLTHPNPWTQFVDVFTRTKDTLGALFSAGSGVQPRHLSGPVGIVQMIWLKVKYGGIREGVAFIILVSYSLAFFNLLPVPVLDGGHILFALPELATGRAVPARILHVVQNVFAVLLIGFMLYITFFDVRRVGKFLGIVDSGEKKQQEEKQPGGVKSENEKESTDNAPAKPE